jgi:hypothetical protein
MTGTFQQFAERAARVTVSVTRNNAQGAAQTYTYVYTQNRMRLQVRQGGKQYGNAHIEIFGVAQQDMNQIARLWLEVMTPQNADTVAIDVWNGMQYIPFFQGVIMWSAVDASTMPQVKLVIDSNAAMPLMNTPVAPYSNPGPVTLSDALADIAGQAGFAVVYSASVPVYSLTNPRVTGSPLEQINALMSQYPDLTWFVNLQQVVIRLAGAPSDTDAVRIAVDTGLQYAPVYSTSGLSITTIFNPLLRPGIALDVETTFDFVNRTNWVAAVLSHQLDINLPGGQWNTAIAANSYGAKSNN